MLARPMPDSFQPIDTEAQLEIDHLVFEVLDEDWRDFESGGYRHWDTIALCASYWIGRPGSFNIRRCLRRLATSMICRPRWLDLAVTI